MAEAPVSVIVPQARRCNGAVATTPPASLVSPGRRPIVAFGNSDGDFEMLEWTTLHPIAANRRCGHCGRARTRSAMSPNLFGY
jgi:hypothetical protein